MCGINGIVGANDPSLVKEMNRAIKHRGPDQDGYFSSNGIDMGMQRLSIIDVKHGRQPLFNEDKTVAVVFNGEIYNFLELRAELETAGHRFATNSDTEVLAHGYEEWGPALPEHLNGMFAYAIWDEAQKKLTLARDRFGKKPLYYRADQKSGTLIFASEIKSFLALKEFDRAVDAQAVRNYLNLRFIPGPRTIFSSVKKLMPGHQLFWKNGKHQTARYWRLARLQKSEKFDSAVKGLQEDFLAATKRRLISEVPLGAFLSGGVDSATVVAAMSKFKEEPVKTFSIGFSDSEFDESKQAEETARQLGTDHHSFYLDENALQLLEKVVWHCDEPLADPTCIPTYVLAREAKKEVTVVLTGEGADEIFGGYEQYKIIHYAKHLRHLPKIVRHAGATAIGFLPKNITNRAFRYYSALGARGQKRFEEFAKDAGKMPKSYLDMVEIFTDEETKRLLLPEITAKTGYEIEKTAKIFMHSPHNALQDMQYFEIQYALPDNLLMKTDKMCMASSVEARCPYLDHPFAQKAFNLPDSQKISGYKDKLALRKIAHNLGLKASKRKKARFFVPVDKWLGGELKDIVRQATDTAVLKERGFFKFSEVQEILKGYDASPAYTARQLWVLACLELWHKQYVDAKQ